MSDARLDALRDLIQEDVGNRGLRTDPSANLITACAGDFKGACRSLLETADPAVAVVTGFYIPLADPPCGETDGPLGALFLARALAPLGIKTVLVTDPFCAPALQAGLGASGLRKLVPLVTLPSPEESARMTPADYWQTFSERAGRLTHLIALERVGPSHTEASLRAQPGTTPKDVDVYLHSVTAEHHDRCHTMRGRDITAKMSPAHLLFEAAGRQTPALTTIGIGDGGNEVGMGKVPWNLIRRNVPGGGVVACRVPTDHLIVCGISNWGAYALAAGVRLLRGEPLDAELLDPAREEALLKVMVQQGPLCDGITAKATATVDGLTFHRYAEPLRRMGSTKVRSNPLITLPSETKGTEPASERRAGGAADLRGATGAEVRRRAAAREFTGPTTGLALGYVQANLVIVPRALAFDFLLFCQRNSKACPLLDVTEPGSPEPRLAAPGADLRTDVPAYRVYRDGELVDEPAELRNWWRDDLVSFLLGCSFTFENALLQAGLPLRHLETAGNVPMYRTKRMCRPAGVFRGPMVVSMRPMTPAQAITATRICARFPRAHGAPIHFGDPEAIGIRDLARPDFGDAVTLQPGEVPVFWACGVTAQAVAMEARPPLVITHKPGHMFVTDWRDTELELEV